jgi:alpha-1,2-mannosyltransferase
MSTVQISAETGTGWRRSAGRLWLIGVCVAAGLAGWAFWPLAMRGAPGQDWMVFYTAGRAYFDDNLALIYDGERFTQAINHGFAGWLALPLNLHPWVYPPTFLLLFLPAALLPASASLAAFLAAGFAAAMAAAWLCVGRRAARSLLAATLLLCPAVPFTVMTGQNAFMTGALLLGGFGLLARQPILAGGMLGLLTYKPQFWLMVPVALVAARQWRALGASLAAALALALASLAVFGTGPWQSWIELMTGPSEAYRAWVTAGRLNGVSVFACASLLGAPALLANLAQATAVAVAAASVYWVFRRRAGGALPLSCVLAATILAAPHASTSDCLLLGLAAALFLACLLTQEFRPIWGALAAAVWISPLFNPPSVFRVGLLTPLLIVLLLAAIIAAIAEEDRQTGSPNRKASA